MRVKIAVQQEQAQMDRARQPIEKTWFRFPMWFPSFQPFQIGMAAACAVFVMVFALSFKNKTRFESPSLPPLAMAIHQSDVSDTEAVAVLFDLMEEGEEEEISEHFIEDI